MLPKVLSGVSMLVVATSAMHEWPANNITETAACVAPGTCVAPVTKYSRVVPGPVPGRQWEISGGFCGAWSTQQCMLSVGAYVSQDLVRKANRDQTGIKHFMHGDRTVGYEVMPVNVDYTAAGLKATYEMWDSKQPAPQAPAYKAWLKKHLSAGKCVIWFPMCKGDGHKCYPFSCPDHGTCDHVEPMFGIFSNHPLTDPTVYDDDVILHASDQDMQPYYRPMHTLEDTPAMAGNCQNAQPGFGRNEMYPCFDEQVTYGAAIIGLNVQGTLPLSLSVDDAAHTEPDVRSGSKANLVNGTVTVSGLSAGESYQLFRYNSTANLPAQAPFAPTAQVVTNFDASDTTWTHVDPLPFMSDTAVYYLAAKQQ